MSFDSPVETETTPRITTVRLDYWKDPNPQSGKPGFGFATLENPTTHTKTRVYIGDRALVSDPADKPTTGKEVVIPNSAVNWTDPKGPSITEAYLGKEVYEKELRRKTTEITEQLEAAKIEAQRRTNEESKTKALEGKLLRIKETLGLIYGQINCDFKTAITTVLKPEQVIFQITVSYWDNDAKGVSERPGARSYAVFSDKQKLLMYKDTSPQEHSFHPTKDVLVNVKSSAIPTDKILSSASSLGSTDVSITTVEAGACPEAIENSYFTTADIAQKIWKESKWWLLPKETLRNARAAAENIRVARTIWEKEFPGVEPGNIVEAARQINITNPYYADNSSTKWVENLRWGIPPFMEMSEQEFWAEKRNLLIAAANNGNQHAQEQLLADTKEVILQDLWGTFVTVSGIPWSQQYSTQNKWESENIKPSETEKPIPQGYLAYFEDEKGVKQVLAEANYFESRKGAKFYRLYPDTIQVVSSYQEATLKWEEIKDNE